MARIEHGDCREIMRLLIDEGVLIDAVVCDPPYHLTNGFMGKKWDRGNVAFQSETWALCHEMLKPGGYLIAFGGSRTYHRMVCAVEDAGFVIHPMLGWIFGSGFPKAANLGKQFDRDAEAKREVVGAKPSNRPNSAGGRSGSMGGAYSYSSLTAPATEEAQQWDGWYYGGQSLKPALEPICMAQKPPEGRMVDNVREHGTGAVNVDGCRVEGDVPSTIQTGSDQIYGGGKGLRPADMEPQQFDPHPAGRWPANLAHDGSPEALAEFAKYGEKTSGQLLTHHKRVGDSQIGTFNIRDRTGEECNWGGDTGTAARFFYCAKAGKDDRIGSKHPTVKPVALMRWLARLVTQPGGMVLDPFAGTGTTAVACIREGFDSIVIEREAEYVADIQHRLGALHGADAPLFTGQAETA